MSGRPSTIDDGDYYNSQSCVKIEDENNCIETCIANQLKKPIRPTYGIGPSGTDCQEYTDDVVDKCQKQCKLKSIKK
jgi:hypothetical protein